MPTDVKFMRITVFDPTKRGVGDWEVRWRVHLVGGGHKDRRRGGFARKALAAAHGERLVLADAGTPDRLGRRWTLNRSLHLVQLSVDPIEDEEPTTTTSIWSVVTEWRAATWSTSAPETRRGHATAWRMALPLLLAPGAPKMPASVHAYLDKVALRAAVDESPEHAAARSWLDRWTLPVGDLTTERMACLAKLNGRLSKARPALRWAKGRIPGVLPSIAHETRDLSMAGAIPTEAEMWTMAWALGVTSGPQWCALAPLLGSAGLRIGEALDLRRGDLEDDPVTGGMWIEVRHVHSAPGRSWTDHGERTEQRRPKGRAGGKPGRRTFLAPGEASVMRAHLKLFVGDHRGAYLFLTKRGARMDTSHLSRDVWGPARDLAFPSPHRLQTMGRHALRHLAVTRWLRSGTPLTTAARWGGWALVSTMVDFYDSVLPNDDEYAARLMSNRR